MRLGIDERQRCQPVQHAAVLGDDEREERSLTGLALRCNWRNCLAAAIGVLRREDDEAASARRAA